MKPAAKQKWNAKKAQAIMDRKNKALADLSKKHGVKLHPTTVAAIIHPDKKIVDIHHFQGYHHRISWHSPEAKKAYVGSFSYA